MEETYKLSVGDIVVATAGRDAERFFVVISVIDDSYVYIADGKSRRVDAPKRKKVRHIKLVRRADIEFIGSVLRNGRYTNAALRKIIDRFRKTFEIQR